MEDACVVIMTQQVEFRIFVLRIQELSIFTEKNGIQKKKKKD